MRFTQLEQKLIAMFDYEKLQALPEEWGFYNKFDRDIKCVGYATNISPDNIRRAERERVDFLITHHDSWEFIFGLKDSCNQLLRQGNMTHAFFHAPLDDAEFGTSASLAKALGINIYKKVMPYMELYYGGVIGQLPPEDFITFAERVSDILQEKIRCYQNNQKPIQKVAVAAGGGNMTNEMRIAVESGCDTYITGEYVLYSQQYAKQTGMNLLVGSHTNTEILGVESMVRLLCQETDIRLVRIKEPNY